MTGGNPVRGFLHCKGEGLTGLTGLKKPAPLLRF